MHPYSLHVTKQTLNLLSLLLVKPHSPACCKTTNCGLGILTYNPLIIVQPAPKEQLLPYGNCRQLWHGSNRQLKDLNPWTTLPYWSMMWWTCFGKYLYPTYNALSSPSNLSLNNSGEKPLASLSIHAPKQHTMKKKKTQKWMEIHNLGNPLLLVAYCMP